MSRIEEQRILGAGDGRILFVPPMEPYCARLMTAIFRSVGYDARLLVETDETLALGLKYTSGGECVPCPTTVGALLKAMENENVPPERVIFFMPTACGPCRFGQYAKLDQMIFDKLGYGGIRIMSPSAENAYDGLEIGARKRLWHALLVGDIMRKIGMKIRPYEKETGLTDKLIENWMVKLEKAFEDKNIDPVQTLLAQAVEELGKVEKHNVKKPLVGIVGEIYVRSDPFINGQLWRRIEALGGEAALAPMSEWILYTGYIRGLLANEHKKGLGALIEKAKIWLENNFFFEKVEHMYYDIADPILHDRREYPIIEVMEEGCKYLPWQFEGESVLTLGRAALYAKRDGAKAVVNASPMFCMPGTVTTSIFPKLEQELGMRIICNFYDGSGDPNKTLVPVMHYLCEGMRSAQPVA